MPSNALKLAPVDPDSPQEALCVIIGRFLKDEAMPAESAAVMGGLILTACQAYLDTGDPSRAQDVLEPYWVARELHAAHGPEAYAKAVHIAAACVKTTDQRNALVYSNAAKLLLPPKPVGS